MAGNSDVAPNPRRQPYGYQLGSSLLLQGFMRSEPTRPLAASERAARLRAIDELVGSLGTTSRRARTAPRKTPRRSTRAEREAAAQAVREATARRILGPRRAARMLDRGSQW